jgi:hypothetical protein
MLNSISDSGLRLKARFEKSNYWMITESKSVMYKGMGGGIASAARPL